jgi:hypothetical protein
VPTLVIAIVAALGSCIATASAQAANTPYVCPAQGSAAAFAIDEDVLVNTEQTVSVADGTGLPGGLVANNATLTTGRFVTRLSNDSTGYSITSAENGPNWTTVDPMPTAGSAASFSVIATGNNVNLFGPKSQAALAAKGIHVPVLAYTSGLLILHIVVPADGTRPYVDDLTFNGKLVDGCAILAAGA